MGATKNGFGKFLVTMFVFKDEKIIILEVNFEDQT